ncbi:MAG TPA: fused MFS/spermidine synthase [Candidatus Omnitrophota bacterium]|nr:fused MFS/spermidine synthase [Candidatus Omnitrophota bacterium]
MYRHRIFISLTVFITGSAVMILEILGTKVLGPFFGVSLYVWSSQITVTLLSLSIGYWLGGLLSDRTPSAELLYGLIFFSGILTLFLPFAAPRVMGWVEPLGLKTGSLAASFILFSLPLGLLGTVTPFVVKLCVEELRKVGGTAGRLYAVSTVGSLVGTLAAGFLLIPQLPIREIFYFVAAILIILGLLGLLSGGKRRACFLAFCLTVLCAIFLLFFSRDAEAGDAEILFKSQGFYGQIKVVDHEGIRSLLVDGSTQNMVILDPDSDSLFEQSPYTVYLTGLFVVRPEIRHVLMIGLGGGVIPNLFSRYGATVDVIEIDSRMEGVAEGYFGYRPDGGRMIFGDGRYIVNRLAREGKKYDAVILDAFSSYDQPAHLFVREMFVKVREILAEHGVFGINSTGFVKGEASRVTRSIFRTLESVFPCVEVFHLEAEDEIGNFVFFAADEPLEFQPESGRIPPEDRDRLIAVLKANRAKERLGGGIILTDDYNPISFWAIPIYERWREIILKFFGRKILLTL